MDYNDYPENLDDLVVEKLNDEYSGSDVETMNASDILNSLHSNIQELKLGDLLIKIAQGLEKVLHWLEIIKKSDKKNSKMIEEFIISTNKQKDIVVTYVNNKQALVVNCVTKTPNFHKCCVEYSICEFELLENLLSLCMMEDVSINTRCFYDFVLLRLHIYKNIFSIYTA